MRIALVSCLALLWLAAYGGCSNERDGKAKDPPSVDTPTALAHDKRLARLGLVIGPPENLTAACKRVAQETPLTVYCPPVVPKGPVEAPTQRQENAFVFGDKDEYGMSLQSASLVDRESPDAFEAQHWVVAAAVSSEQAVQVLDAEKAKTFTVRGVNATLVAADRSAPGFAGSDHAIAYWEIDDVLYQASVHFHEKAPIAEEIARGLITQMVECGPHSADEDPDFCAWVY